MAGIARPRAANWNVSGLLYEAVSRTVGKEYVDKNIRTWEAMQKVLDSGSTGPLICAPGSQTGSRRCGARSHR